MQRTEPSRVLTQTAEYALRAVLYLAEHREAGGASVTAIAAALGLPASYLSKTLQTLVAAGILGSRRGRGGGFVLAVDPAQLPLMRVVGAFDEHAERRHCLLGKSRCSDARACAAHRSWKPAADEILRFFRGTMVADLAPERA